MPTSTEVMEDLVRLAKATKVKKGHLRAVLGDKRLEELLHIDLYSVKAKEIKPLACELHTTKDLVLDKYNSYMQCISKLIVKMRDLRQLDEAAHSKESDTLEKEIDESLEIECEKDTVMSKLCSLSSLAKELVLEQSNTKSKDVLVAELEEKKQSIELAKREDERRDRKLQLEEEESKARVAKLTAETQNPTPTQPTSNPHPRSTVQLKLFRTEMDKFGGDNKKWQPFWDAF